MKKTIVSCFMLLCLNGLAQAKDTNSLPCVPSWCSANTVQLNPTEHMICQHPNLQIADQLLNQVYQNYRAALQGEARKVLIQEQKQWRLQERDQLTNQHELLAVILERVMALNFMQAVIKQP